MKLKDRRHLHSLFTVLLVVGAVGPAAFADESAAESKNELVVFGGASLLDATSSTVRTVSLPDLGGFEPRRFPTLPGGGFPPISIPPISFQLQTGTSLGSSALIGFRYSRALKSRLWAEADLEVAPSHDLETTGSVCLEGGRCLGTGDFEGAGGRHAFPNIDFDPTRSRPVTAWHYGAGLAYELTGGDVQPFLILGAGGVSWSGSRETSTDFVLRFGAGLKITFGRVGIRLDAVDHFIPDLFLSGNSEHDIHVTAGMLVRF